MFGKKDEKEEKKKVLPKYCPIRNFSCNIDCAWLLEDNEDYVCAVTKIALNT